MQLKFFSVLFVCFLILSCQQNPVNDPTDPPDPSEPTASPGLLKRISCNDTIQHSNWCIRFYYDNQDRVIKIEERDTVGADIYVDTKVYEYSGSDKLPEKVLTTESGMPGAKSGVIYYKKSSSNQFDPPHDSTTFFTSSVNKRTVITTITQHHINGQWDFKGFTNTYDFTPGFGTELTDSASFTIRANGGLSSGTDNFHYLEGKTPPWYTQFNMFWQAEQLYMNPLFRLNIAPLYFLHPISYSREKFLSAVDYYLPKEAELYTSTNYGGITDSYEYDVHHRYRVDSSQTLKLPKHDTVRIEFWKGGAIIENDGPYLIRYEYY